MGDLSRLRPDKDTVILYHTLDGQRTEVARKEIGKTENSEDWRWLFENLPLYAEYPTQMYAYEVEEEPVPGFTSKWLDGNLTNTMQTIDITATKVDWGDEGFEDARPDSLEILLTATAVGMEPLEFPATLTPDALSHTVQNMPDYIGGN